MAEKHVHPKRMEKQSLPNGILLGAESFFGVSLDHRKERMLRSFLEKCAYVVRDVVDRVEELGIPVERITTAGDGARGVVWR